MKSTVDLVDLFGLYLVMQRVAGKGQVKVCLKFSFCLALTMNHNCFPGNTVTLAPD